MIDDMAVYIANLGKYNEGYLVGAWFTFPIDEEDVKEKIGLNEHMRNMQSTIPKTFLLRLASMFPLKNSMRCMK